MKRLMLATVALLGLSLANAQTTNTKITTNTNTGKAFSRRPTVEVRAERSAMRMKDELKLSDDQYTKVYETKLAALNKIQASNEKYRGEAENNAAHKAEKKAAYDEYMKSMKENLSAEQYASWEKAKNERYERWKTAATSQPQAPAPDLEENRMRMDIE